MTVPHMLPSTLMTASASAILWISWLNPTPHRIAVYASQSPSPTPTQHSLPGGPLRPYPCRSSTSWNAPASPDAPFSPMLADLVALLTSGRTAQDVALAVLAAIRPEPNPCRRARPGGRRD